MEAIVQTICELIMYRVRDMIFEEDNILIDEPINGYQCFADGKAVKEDDEASWTGDISIFKDEETLVYEEKATTFNFDYSRNINGICTDFKKKTL